MNKYNNYRSVMFISDIHLCKQKPEITSGFLKFLRTRALFAKALYILGDLFEEWIGDDNPDPLYNRISFALQELHQNGVNCFFIHGNHDLLLSKNYAKSCKMTILPDRQILNIDGDRIMILHGDTLCTKDIYYQIFRRIVFQPWVQKLFLLQPLRFRLYLANRIRNISYQNNLKKSNTISNINIKTVKMIMSKLDLKILIHGHTHQSKIHVLSKKKYHIALGAWNKTGSVLEIVKNEMKFFSFNF